jgi:hypothetical protein
MLRTTFRTPLLMIALAATPALAADGVLEINQTCATQTGCFTGDSPGFPVQITAAGSYRLTSNLTVPGGTNGIVAANGAWIDLAGFEIAGPVTCFPSCPPPGAGSGVTVSLGSGNRAAVTNGRVRGFSGSGVVLGELGRVERVTVTDIGAHGISLGAGSLATGNLVDDVGLSGIVFPSLVGPPGLYRDNVIGTTGETSVVSGKASGPNACGDLLCGTSGKKLFYLTSSLHSGSAADTACDSGYHLAAVFEIQDLSSVEYDDARGLTQADSGQGPPTGNGREGWIRSGFEAAIGNCTNWTTSSGSGTVGGLPTPAEGVVQAWETVSGIPCSTPTRVWCVQD